MKNITILLLSLFIFSCSTDDSTTVENTGNNNEILNISLEDIENGVFAGNVTLASQEAVNLFGTLNITQVIGNLLIGSNNIGIDPFDITDLTPLSGLTQVNGEIIISNTLLVNLDGLQNIVSSNSLNVNSNTVLQSMNGLSPQIAISNKLIIQENNELISLMNFDNIDFLHLIRIRNNNILEGLNGLESLVSADIVNILSNPLLTDLEGLHNLTMINDNISIRFNSGLLNMNGLESLMTVSNPETEASFMISNNSNLTTLNGLENLTEIDILEISNFNLNDFCSLQNLFLNGTFDTVIIEGNEFNPTIADIQAGNCNN